MGFGNKLKEIRELHKLSGEETANRLRPFLSKKSVSKATVSGWEKRIDSPSQEVVDAYCKVFNLSESELRGLNNPSNITSVEKPSDDLRQEVEDLRVLNAHYKQKIKDLEKKLSDCQAGIRPKLR